MDGTEDCILWEDSDGSDTMRVKIYWDSVSYTHLDVYKRQKYKLNT